MDWIQTNWEMVSIIGLAAHTFLKAIRDAIDKTPGTDDNIFEKIVSIVGKIVGYLFGSRPK